ncbi:MAG: hypothetical protein H7070_10970 [Saprospiraceae bacterium]|nr:hypothetical protein [Pyrinomonadaceae bacterium]
MLGLCLCSRNVYSQSSDTQTTAAPPPEIHVEDDPTKPILFSIRNEYRNLKGGAWADTLLLRVDKLSFRNVKNKGGAKGIIFRLDIPLNTVHRGSTTKFGLGDVYGQALYIPHVRRGFALAVGSGIVLPTATNDLLGQGKVIVAPAVVPVWFFSKRQRLALVRFQNFVSVAGKKHRPNVNFFVADPTVVHRLSKKWWITANTEFKWDWRTKRGSGISGVQIGRMVQGKVGFWLKPEIPWGRGRQGDFTVKFTVFRVR